MALENELGFRHPIQRDTHAALLNLYYTAAQVKKKADEFFKAHGLTDVQFNVMILLSTQAGETGGLTQIELSRMMLVNRANVTSLIDRMEKAGLVKREASQDDRRYNVVKLTPKGKRKFKQVADPYHARVRTVMNALSPEEMESLTSMLDRIRKAAETVMPE